MAVLFCGLFGFFRDIFKQNAQVIAPPIQHTVNINLVSNNTVKCQILSNHEIPHIMVGSRNRGDPCAAFWKKLQPLIYSIKNLIDDSVR